MFGLVGAAVAVGLLALLRMTILKPEKAPALSLSKTSPPARPMRGSAAAPSAGRAIQARTQPSVQAPQRGATAATNTIAAAPRKHRGYKHSSRGTRRVPWRERSDSHVYPATGPAKTATRPATTPAKTATRPTTGPTSMPAAETAEAKILAGKSALAAGRIERAIAYFRGAAELAPDDTEALRGLAMALLMAERFDQSISVYRKLIRLDVDDKTARFNLAMALARKGDFHGAQDVYLALLERWSDSVEARSNLAGLYQLQGKLADARRQWREVIRRSPDSPAAYEALGEVCADLRKPQEAMDAYAAAARLQPAQASAWLNYAAAAAAAGSGGRAVMALEQATKLAPYDAEAWAMRGNILLELYRAKKQSRLIRQAMAAWKKSLELDGSQKDLRRRLKTYSQVDNDAPQ